jgi:hypothetical protein
VILYFKNPLFIRQNIKIKIKNLTRVLRNSELKNQITKRDPSESAKKFELWRS